MKTPKRKSLKTLEAEVERFNATHKVGDMVDLSHDDGTVKRVQIKHEATILGGHTAVGWFHEISGCYSLDKVLKR